MKEFLVAMASFSASFCTGGALGVVAACLIHPFIGLILGTTAFVASVGPWLDFFDQLLD